MSKYFDRIFTIIDLHFGAMQPCSSGLGMTLEASDFRSVRRLVAYSIYQISVCCACANSRRFVLRNSEFAPFYGLAGEILS